jgi:hypothetical protein
MLAGSQGSSNSLHSLPSSLSFPFASLHFTSLHFTILLIMQPLFKRSVRLFSTNASASSVHRVNVPSTSIANHFKSICVPIAANSIFTPATVLNQFQSLYKQFSANVYVRGLATTTNPPAPSSNPASSAGGGIGGATGASSSSSSSPNASLTKDQLMQDPYYVMLWRIQLLNIVMIVFMTVGFYQLVLGAKSEIILQLDTAAKLQRLNEDLRLEERLLRVDIQSIRNDAEKLLNDIKRTMEEYRRQDQRGAAQAS